LDHPLKDKDDPPEKTGVKYLTLSSTGKRMGTTSGSPIHFVGDPCSRVVYVTEGTACEEAMDEEKPEEGTPVHELLNAWYNQQFCELPLVTEDHRYKDTIRGQYSDQ
jgi:hypothetical protein